ncbi:MAG: hypothetical protein ABS35_11925 [Kaistia sp. SCN 65-12]|nr:MAG: hypothetical protein ABS35_11925 [Kaistia sp. SCN 65-12]
MESSRLAISEARELSEAAVKKLVGLSSAEFTLSPVARRSCVLAIEEAVDCRLSRFERTAFDRFTSAILEALSGSVLSY